MSDQILEVRSGFNPLPTRDSAVDVSGFAAWLAKSGAEIGIPSNPYEVIRYRCYDATGKMATHILYRKESGQLTWTGQSFAHYESFINGEAFPRQPDRAEGVFLTTYPTASAQQGLVDQARYEGWVANGKPPSPSSSPFVAPPVPARSRSNITRERLLERDGDECWFCGKGMGADSTIEHLVPKSAGGRNMLANYALAHRSCNNGAGNMPLIKKIEMRNRLRAS